MDEVTQGRSTERKRLFQNLTHGQNDSAIALETNTAGGSVGMDSVAVQRFTRIDIANPNDDAAIHNKVFYRDFASPSAGV